MRFIITAQASADKKATEQQPDFDAELFKAYMRFNEEMHQAGILVASEGLNPLAPGARIAVASGKRYVVDGPLAESKELTGSGDLPPEILQLIAEAAATWSASAWQSRSGG